MIAQRLEPRVRRGLQPGRRDGDRRTCWCCSTTTPSVATAGSNRCSPISRVPDVGMVGPTHEPDRQRGPGRRRLPDLGRARPLRRGARARARGRGIRDRDPDDVLRRDAPRRCTSRSGRSTSASRSACSRTTTTRAGCARPGYRLLCADDAFVHHFGETSFGKLVRERRVRPRAGGEPRPLRGEVAGAVASPTSRRQSDRYRELVERVRQAGGRRRPGQTRRCWSSAGATRSCCAWTVAGRGTSRAATTAPMRATIRPTAARPSRRLEEQRAAGAEYIVFPGDRSLVARALRGAPSAPRRQLRAQLLAIPRPASSSTCGSARDERADDRLHPRHAPQRDLAGVAGAERARPRPRPGGAPDAPQPDNPTGPLGEPSRSRR